MYRDDLDAALARADSLESENSELLRRVEEYKALVNKQIATIRGLRNSQREEDSAPVTISPHKAVCGQVVDAHRYGSSHYNEWAFNGGSSNGSSRGGW